MTRTENDLDIYYAVGNANTSKQETEMGDVIKKRNLLGWKLVPIKTAVDENNINSPTFISFWGKYE